MSTIGPAPSSPDFNISKIAILFLKEKVQAFKSELKGKHRDQSQKIELIFNTALMNLHHDLGQVKTYEAFEKITRTQISDIQLALEQIHLGRSIDLSQLTHSFQTCQKISEKEKEIEEEDLKPYIEEPWLEDFLDSVLQTRSIEIGGFFRDNREHPLIKRLIERALKKEPDSARYLLVMLSRNDLECSWAKDFLIQAIEKNNDPLLLKILVKTIGNFYVLKEYNWLLENVLKWAENQELYGLELFLVFLNSESTDSKKKEVIDFMIQKSEEGNHKWQVITIAAISMNKEKIINQPQLDSATYSTKINGLDRQSQICFQNAERWVARMSSQVKSYRKLKNGINEFRIFQICLMTIESYLQMHLFIVNPSDYKALAPNGSCFFPKAKGILFGHVLEYQLIVNDVGKYLSREGLEGITCYQCARSSQDKFKTIKILPPIHTSAWFRDDVQLGYTDNREMVFKISNFIFNKEDAFRYIRESQVNRFGINDYHYGWMGKSFESLTMLEVGNIFYELPKEPKKKLDILWTYGEGGNFRFGIDRDGHPYCLLGKDTLELNRAILLQEIRNGNYSQTEEGFKFEGYTADIDKSNEYVVSDEMLINFFKRDYGKDIQFIPIEQPCSFHIDMKLSIVGPKKVILNDSVESLKVALDYFKKELQMTQEEWDEKVKIWTEQAEHEKVLEDRCEADLVQAGFEVVRVPGVFQNIYREVPELEKFNFFNHITLETSDDPPRHILFALGCPFKFQELFRKIIKEHCAFKDVEIFFVNQAASQLALRNSGGINCLTQVLEEEI